MRTLIALLAIMAMTVAADAQGTRKGKRQQPSAQKTEDVAKKKALDEDYKNALKNIPQSNEKPDPWKTMR